MTETTIQLAADLGAAMTTAVEHAGLDAGDLLIHGRPDRWFPTGACELDLPDGTTLRAYADDTDLHLVVLVGRGQLASDEVVLRGNSRQSVLDAVVDALIQDAMRASFA